jgi:hypothetical protein
MYLRVKDGKPTISSITDLRRENPQVSFPQNIPKGILEEYGYYWVEPVDVPSYNPLTQLVERSPFMEGGVWYDGWLVKDKPEELLQGELNERRANHVCTMRQARLSLLRAGLLEGVESFIASLDNPAITVEWEYAQEIHRDSQLVNSLSSELGISDSVLDDLFEYAMSI